MTEWFQFSFRSAPKFGGGRSLGLLVACAVLLGISAPGTWADEDESGTATTIEYQVKAGFIFNFAKFETWPTNVMRADAPLRVGIFGGSEVQKVLTAELSSKRVDSHAIAVVRCHKADDVTGCHIIFIARTEAEHARDVLKSAGARPVLTIGESDRFAVQGGCINFVRKGDNIRFEINPAAVERAGLRISSKVAAIAIIVQPGGSKP